MSRTRRRRPGAGFAVSPRLDRLVTLTYRDPGMRDRTGVFQPGQSHTLTRYGRLLAIDERYDPLPEGGRTGGQVRVLMRLEQAVLDAAEGDLTDWEIEVDTITYAVYSAEQVAQPRRRFMTISGTRG